MAKSKLSEITPFYDAAGVKIFCTDSTAFADEIAALDGLVIADPPYGISERTDRKTAGRGGLAQCNDFPSVIGDDKPFDPSPWLDCDRLVLWGANYYADKLPPSSSWLVWDKRDGQGPNDNADCELAWTNFAGPARLYHHTWNGALRASEKMERRSHPTQKPVSLMHWVIEELSKPGDVIIDPYMGSGSSLVAARRLGLRSIGFELSPDYCRVAIKRLESDLPLIAIEKFPKSKRCPSCTQTFTVIPGETFNLKTASLDGLQPWCRACDMKNKNSKYNGWKNFSRALKKDHPLDAVHWDKVTYLKLMGNFECVTCGSNVEQWSGGYWVDRVSNSAGYLPSNCRPCCWGCNRMKGNRNPESAYPEIERHVNRYGWGKVPWTEIYPTVKRIDSKIPDLSEYIITDQLSLATWKHCARPSSSEWRGLRR